MFWYIAIPFGLVICAVLFIGLHTRRLVHRFNTHLQQTRDHLDSRLHQRRNLIPSLIALSAGAPGMETECLETVDNAAELVIRSQGFDERLLAENRLSSALAHLRKRLTERVADRPPDLTALLEELDNREVGIVVATDLFNRQVVEYRESFTRPPQGWLAPLCGFHPPHPVELRLSTTPPASNHRRSSNKEDSTP